jgi:P4 family phage/plasmid primase-like protien
VWEGDRWRKDLDGLTDRWVVEVGEEFLPTAQAAYTEALERGEGVGNAGAILRRVQSLGDHFRIRATLDRAKTVIPGIAIRPEDLDNKQNMLGVPNGTIVLDRTGATLEKTNHAHLLTLNTGVNYRPEAKDPIWHSYLKTFIPDRDLREFLQRVMGYSLLGGNPEGLLFTLDGATRTGKSTLLGAMKRALGDYASPFDLTAFRGKFEAGPREDLASIMSVRFAYVSEVNGAFELHADQVKRLTGDDMLSFNRKYEHQQTRYPDFTAVVAANGKPRVKGADKAMRERICTIPFLVSMPSRSRKAEAMRETAVSEAVLAWVVEGYNRYCSDGIQAETWPTAVVEATHGTRASLDDIDDFLAEACEVDAGYRHPTKDFYPAYRNWCSESGVKSVDILPRQLFGESLHDRGYEQKTKWVEGKNVKVRFGIKLKDGWSGITF